MGVAPPTQDFVDTPLCRLLYCLTLGPAVRDRGKIVKKYAFLLVCLTARLAVAADAPAPAPTPASGAADSSLKFEENTSLSDAEKENRSGAAVQKMRQVLKSVLGILEEARNSKDIVRLNCVNEKLTQVKGFIRIAEQADVSLQEAVAKQEGAAANHEFTKIEVASQRVDQLHAEAEACNGATVYENGNAHLRRYRRHHRAQRPAFEYDCLCCPCIHGNGDSAAAGHPIRPVATRPQSTGSVVAEPDDDVELFP